MISLKDMVFVHEPTRRGGVKVCSDCGQAWPCAHSMDPRPCIRCGKPGPAVLQTAGRCQDCHEEFTTRMSDPMMRA